MLRGQRRQPHLWRVFNGRSLVAPATREDEEDFLSEFPKGCVWALESFANKFSIQAGVIYAGPGGTANTLASVEAYLEALCLLRKSMVYLDDNDQSTLLLASRVVLKLNRHLMWKTISTQFGSWEAFLKRGIPGNEELEERACQQAATLQQSPGKLPVLDLDIEFALQACAECYTIHRPSPASGGGGGGGAGESATPLAMCAACKRVADCSKECQLAN